MQTEKPIVLFDIDGTLMLTNGAGTLAMNRAFGMAFGISDSPSALDGLDIAGRSDKWIAESVMSNHGIDATAQNIGTFIQTYASELPRALREQNGNLLPGVVSLLQALISEGAIVGLGTGNFRVTGMLKLGYFNIDHYFRDGGFGDDSADRPEILAAGLDRLRVEADPSARVIVIGDTEHDVTAGHAIGAKVVAVATGTTSYDELITVGAESVFTSLENVDDVLTAILK